MQPVKLVVFVGVSDERREEGDVDFIVTSVVERVPAQTYSRLRRRQYNLYTLGLLF